MSTRETTYCGAARHVGAKKLLGGVHGVRVYSRCAWCANELVSAGYLRAAMVVSVSKTSVRYVRPSPSARQLYKMRLTGMPETNSESYFRMMFQRNGSCRSRSRS